MPPHWPVTSATIGHWLKRIQSHKYFTAHSTRGAATSKASAAGISIPDIHKRADWSSASMFKKFYHRPITPSKFGQAVLSGRESVSSKVSYKWYHVVNYVVVGYPVPPKYNFRFLKDWSNLMGRMNCMRRWRITGDNIVSHPLPTPYFTSQVKPWTFDST